MRSAAAADRARDYIVFLCPAVDLLYCFPVFSAGHRKTIQLDTQLRQHRARASTGEEARRTASLGVRDRRVCAACVV
eukprot:SAG31_NODE_21778_length_541_cov_0.699095_1_plen_76_part_10